MNEVADGPLKDPIYIALGKIGQYGSLSEKSIKASRLVDMIHMEPEWSDDEKAIALSDLIVQLIDTEQPDVEEGNRLAVKAALNFPSGDSPRQDHEGEVAQQNGSTGLLQRLFDFQISWERIHPKDGLDNSRQAVIGRARQWWVRGRKWLAKTLRREIDSRNRSQGWQKVPVSISSADAHTTPKYGHTRTTPVSATSSSTPLAEAAQLALAGLDKSAFGPITVDPQKPLDWRAVLDGSPLTPTHAAHNLIIPRRVLLHNREIQEPFAEWLTRQRGRTVFLYGAAGDGKSSYLNKLAVDSVDTHIFLRWSSDLPPDFRMLENYRQSVGKLLDSQTASDMPTVVLVCSLRPYGDQLIEERLATRLNDRQLDVDGIVALIDGRPGDLDRLFLRASADKVWLAPINRPEAQKMASLICKAHKRLPDSGVDQQVIPLAYPNLLNFVKLDDDSQVAMLTDESSDEPFSLLARLLSAVYGQDMWIKVQQELELLKNPEDKKAYFHVCLVTATGAALPHHMIEAMTPGADLEARANRDPWLCEDDMHVARNQIIAQVVLEKSAKRRKLFDSCVLDYTGRLEVSEAKQVNHDYLDYLGRIAVGVRNLPPISTADDNNVLRGNLLRALRQCFLNVDGLAQIITNRAGGDYWIIADWLLTIMDLVPIESHHLPHLKLLDVSDALFEAARHAHNCPSVDRTDYYRAKLRLRRQRVLKKRDPELRETVRHLSRFIGRDWCGADFYVDLFSWTLALLEDLPEVRLEGQPAVEGEFLFRTLFTLYEHLRLRVTADELNKKHIDSAHTTMIRHQLVYRLPNKVLNLVEHSWQKSVALGNPNGETAAQYVDMLLPDEEDMSRITQLDEILATASEVLLVAAEANPGLAEPLLLMAIIEKQYGKRVVNDLRERIARALTLNPFSLNKAFADHAAALIEVESSRKIHLLKNAIRGYKDHANEENEPYHPQRVEFAWHSAWKEMQKAGAPDWRRYQP